MSKNPKRKHLHHHPVDEVATIILAGGEGTRLYPLTKTRCKPAVSFGGQYRLIDIPISNSINSGIPHMFIISQYLAASLNNHIKQTFRLDDIQGGWLELLHPEVTPLSNTWYKGTADAIRQNLPYFKNTPSEYFLILSGDQLYNMDLEALIEFAGSRQADLTIATLPVTEKEASRMGILRTNAEHQITSFAEKTKEPHILDQFRLSPAMQKAYGITDPNKSFIASMGIYIFKREALFALLEEDTREDFGKFLIPTQIAKHGKTYGFLYDGYWEDIGTIASYYEANLALTRNELGLNLYDETSPIIAHNPHLPCPRITGTRINHSIICQGAIVEAEEVSHSIIGVRSQIKKGTVIRESIIMGNQFYDTPDIFKDHLPTNLSIGANCRIEGAIIDEHAHIGNNVTLVNSNRIKTLDRDQVVIRDGVIIVLSGASLPDGFTL